MNKFASVRDAKPYLEVKDAIVARSGIYRYSRAEVLARGLKPTRVKDYYDEFRPAGAIAAAAPLFDLVLVPNREHTEDDITAENFHEHASGVVGGPIQIVPMPNGIDIGLQGRIAFYTKEAYNYYMAGNKETSADYVSDTELVDNPEEVGYDILLKKIVSVNNVAITAMGRGGKDVRIKDSAMPKFSGDRGGDTMGLLANFLQLGRADGKFSAVVKDSLEKKKGMDEVLAAVHTLPDTPMRSALEGVVRDSFAHQDEVLGRWTDSADLIDKVYARCMDAKENAEGKKDEKAKAKEDDEEAKAKAKEDDEKAKAKAKEDDEKAEKGKKKEEEDEEDKKKEKESKSKDSASVDAKIDALRSELPSLMEDVVKKVLGIEASAPSSSRTQDSGIESSIVLKDEDASFVLDGAFGHRA